MRKIAQNEIEIAVQNAIKVRGQEMQAKSAIKERNEELHKDVQSNNAENKSVQRTQRKCNTNMQSKTASKECAQKVQHIM